MIPDQAPTIDWESVRRAMFASCMPVGYRPVFTYPNVTWEACAIPPTVEYESALALAAQRMADHIDRELIRQFVEHDARHGVTYSLTPYIKTHQETPMPNLVFQFKDGEYLTPVPSPMPVNRNPFFTGGRYRTPKPELAWCFTSVNDALINLYRLITFVGMNGGELPDTPPRLVEVVKRERTVTEWLTRDITVLMVH